jgi:hypothetical protein
MNDIDTLLDTSGLGAPLPPPNPVLSASNGATRGGWDPGRCVTLPTILIRRSAVGQVIWLAG